MAIIQGGKRLIHEWWANLIAGIISLAIAYGLASVAINSGSMWAYLFTIVFLAFAINRGIASWRYARGRSE